MKQPNANRISLAGLRKTSQRNPKEQALANGYFKTQEIHLEKAGTKIGINANTNQTISVK